MNSVKQYGPDGPINYEPTGYNPSFGIYASNYLFTGDWEDELTNLQYTKRAEPVSDANIAKFDDEYFLVDGRLLVRDVISLKDAEFYFRTILKDL